MNPAIGLVVALGAEAKTLIGRGRWQALEGFPFRRIPLPNRTDLLVGRSGLGMKRAASVSESLIRVGVVALGISGVSGGLAPDLEVGDLVIADTVIGEADGGYGQAWETDAGFADRAYGAIAARGLPSCRGPILTLFEPVFSCEEKASLFGKTQALAVDMESAAVAAAATRANLPFFAIRAVSDAVNHPIPEDLFGCVDASGRLRPFHLFKSLFLKPTLFLNLFGMRRHFQAALTSLGRAWNPPITAIMPSLLV